MPVRKRVRPQIRMDTRACAEQCAGGSAHCWVPTSTRSRTLARARKSNYARAQVRAFVGAQIRTYADVTVKGRVRTYVRTHVLTHPRGQPPEAELEFQ